VPRPGEIEFDADGVLVGEADPAEPRGCTRRARRLSRWSRRTSWVRRLALPGTLFFGLIAASETAVLAAQAANFPEMSTWASHHVGWWIFNIVAVLTLVLTSLLAWRLGGSLAERREELILQQHCRSLWRYLNDAKELPAEDLGVHVWSVQDPRVWFIPHWITSLINAPTLEPDGWRGFVPRAPFLQRRAAFTSERRVHPAMTFTRDKGVIGRCWRLEREIVENLEPLRAAETAAEFYRLFPYDKRYGLDWRHWWNTRHFCAIWVYPVYAGPVGARRFAGCISVDLKHPGMFSTLESIAENKDDALDSLLWDLAAVLRGDWKTTH
jgi:hypothetical protein